MMEDGEKLEGKKRNGPADLLKKTACNDGKTHIPLGVDSVCSGATGDVSDH